MKHRISQLLASEAATTATTKTLELNITDPISRITIRMKGTNNGSTPTAHPALMVSKIELVDGSDVLFSLSGKECVALNFYEEGELPHSIVEYENDIQVSQTYHMNFGKFLWDRELALDPRKFNNIQLKITHNKANGGSSPDAGTLAIFAHVFDDDAPTPRAFLMSKEQFTYTLTASAAQEIELARDFPYRFIMPMSHSAANSPNNQYNKIKFTLDHDAKVLINDISVSELLKVMMPMDKVEENFGMLGSGSAVAHYIVSAYENYGVGVGRSAAGAGIIVAQPSGSLINITNDSSESAAIYITGLAPFGALQINLVDKMDEATWLDPRPWKSVQLVLTAGSGGSGTIQIVTQQLRPY